jgi:hypothetical protein
MSVTWTGSRRSGVAGCPFAEVDWLGAQDLDQLFRHPVARLELEFLGIVVYSSDPPAGCARELHRTAVDRRQDCGGSEVELTFRLTALSACLAPRPTASRSRVRASSAWNRRTFSMVFAWSASRRQLDLLVSEGAAPPSGGS